MNRDRRTYPRYLVRFFVLVIIACSFLAVLPLAPSAHAVGPAFDVQGNGRFTSTNTGSTHIAVSPANTGELIVVTVSTQDTSVSACSGERTVSSVTDSTGSVTFTELSGGPVCSTTGSHVGISDIWYGLTFSTTSQTCTVNMSGSTAFVWFTCAFFTLIGDAVLSSATGSCQNGGSCAAIATTSTSPSYSSGDIVVGDATSSSGDMSSKGAAFTALNYFTGASDVASCAADAVANFCFQYIVPSSTTTTNFPANLQVSNRDWSDIGVVFGPNTVTLPFACNLSGGASFPAILSPQTVTLSGGSVSPSTATCPIVGATTSLTVTLGATITATAPGCTYQFCYQFLSGSTYSTTTTKVACNSGTCPTWTVTLYALSPAGAPVIGSCPVKNTATTTLANNTVYLYTQVSTGFGTGILPTLQTFVSSVSSTNTPETLTMGIYVAVNQGGISASNPLVLQPPGPRNILLTAGTTNQLVTIPVNFNYNFLGPGYTFGIALAGNSKISINDSALGGMTKFTNLGGGLPVLTTSLGSTTTGLYFCGSLTQQNILFTTSFTTSTTTSTSTTQSGVTTSTSSQIINTPPPSGNWVVPFFWIMVSIAIGIGAAFIIEGIRPK